MNERLKELFLTQYKFSNEYVEDITLLFREVFFRKGEIILEAGKRQKYMYIIDSGLAKSYIYNEEGHLFVLDFFQKNDWIADIIIPDDIPIRYAKQDRLNIMAMSNIKAYAVSKEDIKELISSHRYIDKFFQDFYIDIALSRTEQYINLLTQSAEKRYERFLGLYPDLERTIQQKHIASFLMITPVHLSRMKAKRYKEMKLKSKKVFDDIILSSCES